MTTAPEPTAAAPATTSAAGGALLVLAAATLWGSSGTAQALSPAGVSPMSVGAFRLIVGGAALMILALLRGGLGKGRWPFWGTLAAGGFVAIYQLTFFTAVHRTGVAVGTLVAIGSSPVIAGILGFIIRGERPGRAWGIATVLALAGCSLLVTGGGGVAIDVVGVLLALGAGTSYACYTMAIKVLLPGRTSEAVMAVVFCLGAFLLLPVLFLTDITWVATPRGTLVVLYLGVVITALSYCLFAMGLRSVPVASAVTLSLAEPLVAALLGILFLREHLTPTAMAGIPLLFAGLAVLAYSMSGKRAV